ncbi:MAG: hypothetical protein AB1Z67_05460 [Candidatus Limnocylindrales bacterium]
MGRTRTLRVALSAVVLLLLAAAPASAHTLSGDVDAPLPFAAYLAGAAIAVALSFVFVAFGDDRPAPEPRPGRVRTIWRPLRWTLRLLGLLAWAWVVAQAIAGGTSDAEVASLILWVYGWIGLALVSALLGPVWAWLDPFTTLYDLIAAIMRPTGLHLPGRAPWHPRTQAWPAAILMGFFVWLELSSPFDDGRELGFVLIGYTVITLVGMAWYGKHRWRTHGEVYSVWFGLLGRLAPYGLLGRRRDGQVQRRPFGHALTHEPWSASLLAVVAVAVASVIWDGVSQTQPFYDVFGEPHPVLDTMMLLGFLVLMAVLFIGVGRRVGYVAMGAGLVPVAVGYLVAHYLTFLLVEGQRIVVALSDPFQQGWDLFGTVTYEPSGDFLSASVVWTMQVIAVVLGHVVGAWLGHAAVRERRRTGEATSQWPLAALMIGLTVVALWSLGQNLVFVAETALAM